MPELSTRQRDKLGRTSSRTSTAQGGEHLPIHDESHVRNAISRFNQTDSRPTTPSRKRPEKIMRAAKRHDIEVDQDSDVAEAAH